MDSEGYQDAVLESTIYGALILMTLVAVCIGCCCCIERNKNKSADSLSRNSHSEYETFPVEFSYLSLFVF